MRKRPPPENEKRRPSQEAAQLEDINSSAREYPLGRAENQERPRVRLIEWRPIRRNTLCGFAIVEMPNGLVIRELSIHEKAGKRWVGMPAKPVLGQDGRQIENHAHKKQWAVLVGWRDRDLADRFSGAVVELVRAEHPGDLDGGGR